jgi:subtilisin family serine protease
LFEATNRGGHVAVAAPGVDILVPAPGSLYVMSSGTSFASAFVSGVAALMAERQPELAPDAAKNILMSTAHHLGQSRLRAAESGLLRYARNDDVRAIQSESAIHPL